MGKTNNELLKERIEQNYFDYKSETLLLDEEGIYDMAGRIAAVKDAYYEMTQNGDIGEYEAEYLLNFHNPLEIIADCLEEVRGGTAADMEEALEVLFEQEGIEEVYVTEDLAEELRQKHGAGTSIRLALLQETIEAGERYVRLLKLCDDKGADFCLDVE